MPANRIPLPSLNGYRMFAVTEVDDADGHQTRQWIEILDADGNLIETCQTEEEAARLVTELIGDGLTPG